MAHDRMLSAELRYSEKVNKWPIPLRFFWTQLWGFCDDYGRGRYDVDLIKADTFPKDSEVTVAVIGRWLQALELDGVIVAYNADGKRFFFCPSWDEFQTLRYKRKSPIPDPAESSETLRKVPPYIGGEVEVDMEVGVMPSPYCATHPLGTDDPCRRCGDARRKWQVWEKAQVPKTVSGVLTEPDCPKHPHRPMRGCDRCAEEAA